MIAQSVPLRRWYCIHARLPKKEGIHKNSLCGLELESCEHRGTLETADFTSIQKDQCSELTITIRQNMENNL
jgi:hypothetical protein